eukprot:4353753-Ditylum_brightwellii.AAC.1
MKHLIHCAQVSDHYWVETGKGGANNSADRAVKYLVHHEQVSDHCWEEISKGGANDSADEA